MRYWSVFVCALLWIFSVKLWTCWRWSLALHVHFCTVPVHWNWVSVLFEVILDFLFDFTMYLVIYRVLYILGWSCSPVFSFFFLILYSGESSHFCGITGFLCKILLRRFQAWLHMHDFYLSYGFDFSIFSCQAADLGQGFLVLKFMCKLNQKNSARWVSAPEILLVFRFLH